MYFELVHQAKAIGKLASKPDLPPYGLSDVT
jgi:hypothetical protein